MDTWRASAARGRLADIIEHAAAGRPQFIRRRDGREVVVVSREYFDRTRADMKSYLFANGYTGEGEEEFDRIMEGIRGDTAGAFAPRVPPAED